MQRHMRSRRQTMIDVTDVEGGIKSLRAHNTSLPHWRQNTWAFGEHAHARSRAQAAGGWGYLGEGTVFQVNLRAPNEVIREAAVVVTVHHVNLEPRGAGQRRTKLEELVEAGIVRILDERLAARLGLDAEAHLQVCGEVERVWVSFRHAGFLWMGPW